MFDIVLKNGTIVDGTGKDAYVADIGINKDRIAFIGKIDQEENSYDLEGLTVVPGFIDTHSHADGSVYLYPDCESYIRQGITTFIGGNCGDTNAPIHNFWQRKYWEYDMWDDMDPFIFDSVTTQPLDRAIAVIEKKTGVKIDWRTMGEYFDTIRRNGLACNMISMVGHSQIRADVMGMDQKRNPTAKEMDEMKGLISEAMEAGCWGMSTGRDYPPSAYADVDEIVELMSFIKKKYDGMYCTHWKRTGIRVGTPQKPNKLEGIVEAMEIGLKAGVKTEISHLATGFDIYPEDPRMEKYSADVTMEVIDEYISKGADVAYDVIPGASGGIPIDPYLASYFIPWIKMSGSLAQFIKNLHARDYREDFKDYLRSGKYYAINPRSNGAWDRQIFITKSENTDLTGKSIYEISSMRSMDSIDNLVKLLMDEPKIMVTRFSRSDVSVAELLKHPRASVCTDTYAFDLKGIYGNDMEVPEILPHPHTYCAFPKYILKYGMETFPATIKKITKAPADFFNIKDRGSIEEGKFADIVVMDRNKLKTNENYVEPRVYPEGIDYVFVNGKLAFGNNTFTRVRSGRILTK